MAWAGFQLVAWDVLRLSSRSFLLFWLCVVHRIVSKEGSIVLVSRVSWYMELKRGQWRLMTWEVWKGQSVWWWDGCVGCPWKTESVVRIYAAFLALIVLLMWWGWEDWDGLDIWSVRVWMIGCLLAEGWWWRGREVGDGVGRHGNSVLGMTWNCLGLHPEQARSHGGAFWGRAPPLKLSAPR